MSIKQKLGGWLMPKLPVNRHVINHLRIEGNAAWVRWLHRLHPRYRLRIGKLKRLRDVKLNLGCGPFGLEGWINLDVYPHRYVTMRTDCRDKFPIGDGACSAIHVEHYFEHLTPEEEVPRFLQECRRCLAHDGIVRIIVPDVERFARAYASEGWAEFEALAAPGTSQQEAYDTKMQALNHVMVQGYEHFGGYDYETLAHVLGQAGFTDIRRCSYRDGRLPGGCIDREQHRPYSLYVEASQARQGNAS